MAAGVPASEPGGSPLRLWTRASHRLIDVLVGAWALRALLVALASSVVLAPLTLLVFVVSVALGWGYRRLARRAAEQGGVAALLLTLANAGLAAVLLGPPRPFDAGWLLAQALSLCCLLLGVLLVVPLWHSVRERHGETVASPALGVLWRRGGELLAVVQVVVVVVVAVRRFAPAPGAQPLGLRLDLLAAFAAVLLLGYLVITVFGLERGVAVSISAIGLNLTAAVVAARTSPASVTLSAVAHDGAAVLCGAVALLLVAAVWRRLRPAPSEPASLL